MHTTEATHSSYCPDCQRVINPGDTITRDNAFERWRHASCPTTKYDFDPTDVCGDCFTVRAANGKCAC